MMKRKVIYGLFFSFIFVLIFASTTFASSLIKTDSYDLVGIIYYGSYYDISIVGTYGVPVNGSFTFIGEKNAEMETLGVKDSVICNESTITHSWGEEVPYSISGDTLYVAGDGVEWVFTKARVANTLGGMINKDEVQSSESTAPVTENMTKSVLNDNQKDTSVETQQPATVMEASSLTGIYSLKSISYGGKSLDSKSVTGSVTIDSDNTGIVSFRGKSIPITVMGNSLVDSQGTPISYTLSGNSLTLNYWGYILSFVK